VDHLRHFGLSEDPFRDEPRVRDFCETRAMREALLRVERGLRQGRGLGVVSGEAGSGKSMLLRRLLDGLEEELFEASMLVVLPGAAEAGALLSRFARHLGVEDPAPERQTLLGQIFEQLAIVREEGRRAVLLVDDADVLARAGALAELVGLLRLEYEERRLLSLLLAGSPALDAALAASPDLAQRVDFRGRLAPLQPDDAARYLGHRIAQAGGDPAILGAEAGGAIHRLGRGLPGLMNRLADNALFEAFLCGRRVVSRADVERAHRDLGFSGAPEPLRPAEAGGAAERGGAAPARAAAWPGGADPPCEPAPIEAAPEPFDPFAGDGDALGDLDSELEAIFEGAEEPPRRLRIEPEKPLVAQFLED
jgi:type II secretory pathway predicted ATPase ExeA